MSDSTPDVVITLQVIVAWAGAGSVTTTRADAVAPPLSAVEVAAGVRIRIG